MALIVWEPLFVFFCFGLEKKSKTSSNSQFVGHSFELFFVLGSLDLNETSLSGKNDGSLDGKRHFTHQNFVSFLLNTIPEPEVSVFLFLLVVINSKKIRFTVDEKQEKIAGKFLQNTTCEVRFLIRSVVPTDSLFARIVLHSEIFCKSPLIVALHMSSKVLHNFTDMFVIFSKHRICNFVRYDCLFVMFFCSGIPEKAATLSLSRILHALGII